MRAIILGPNHRKNGDSSIYVQTETRNETGKYLDVTSGTFLLDAGLIGLQQGYLFKPEEQKARNQLIKSIFGCSIENCDPELLSSVFSEHGLPIPNPLTDISNLVNNVLLTHNHGDHSGGLGSLVHHHKIGKSAKVYGPKGDKELCNKGMLEIGKNRLNSYNLVEPHKPIKLVEIHGDYNMTEVFEQKNCSYVKNKESTETNEVDGKLIYLIRSKPFFVTSTFGDIHSSSKDRSLAYSITELNYGIVLSPGFENLKTPAGFLTELKKLQSQVYKRTGNEIQDTKDLKEAMIQLYSNNYEKIVKKGIKKLKPSEILPFFDHIGFLYSQNKLTFITDSPQVEDNRFIKLAKDSDLLICGTPKLHNPHKKDHLSVQDAKRLAMDSNSNHLVLTHLNDKSMDAIVAAERNIHSASIDANSISEFKKIQEELKNARINFDIAKKQQAFQIRNKMTLLD